MKLVLSGATGFIGRVVLTEALSNPEITNIIALSRKPLPAPYDNDPKVKTIIVQDFTTYTNHVLDELKEADAAIWTIGAKSTDPEVTRKVTVDYTMAAATAFTQMGRREGKKFRFVFMSGVLAVRDPEKSVWLYGDVRRVAGQAETKLIEFGKANETNFEGYILRPAAVTTNESSVKNVFMGLVPSITVSQLAAASLDLAINGDQTKIWENMQLKRKGTAVLKGQY